MASVAQVYTTQPVPLSNQKQLDGSKIYIIVEMLLSQGRMIASCPTPHQYTDLLGQGWALNIGQSTNTEHYTILSSTL